RHIFIFFLIHYRPPPYQHSSPTRRSSDLESKLFRETAAIGFDGLGADEQLVGNFAAAESFGHQFQDLQLALAEDRGVGDRPRRADRKSTRLNSSHVKISYAVFCL